MRPGTKRFIVGVLRIGCVSLKLKLWPPASKANLWSLLVPVSAARQNWTTLHELATSRPAALLQAALYRLIFGWGQSRTSLERSWSLEATRSSGCIQVFGEGYSRP